MRNLSPLAVVVVAALISVSSFTSATAPQMRDVPDLKVVNGESVRVDLKNYTYDIDNVLSSLTYDATRAVQFPIGVTVLADGVQQMVDNGGSVMNSSGALLLPSGPSAGSVEALGVSVEDASGDVAYEGAQMRGVSMLVGSPSLTTDARLTCGYDISMSMVPYTWPVFASSATAANVPETRTISTPLVGGSPLTASQWVTKLSYLTVEKVTPATAAVSTRVYTRRVVTDAQTTALGSNTTDSEGRINVTIDGSGNVTIDPLAPFSSGAIVIGIKGVQSGTADTTPDYMGATVLVPQLVDRFYGIAAPQNTPAGYPFSATQAQNLPMGSTYYFEGIPATTTVTVPTSGLFEPLAAGITPWLVGNPGTSYTSGTGELGKVHIRDGGTYLPPNLQDPRFTSGNVAILSVTSTQSVPPSGFRGRSSILYIDSFVLDPNKVYAVSVSAYADIVNEGSNEANLKFSVATTNFNQSKTLFLEPVASIPSGSGLPTCGWRKLSLKWQSPDFSWMPPGQGNGLEDKVAVKLELLCLGPWPGFSGVWNPWIINLVIDNLEIYELPGFDIDMALGSTQLFGQTHAYPNVIPATGGMVIGDFEGTNVEYGSATPVDVDPGDSGRPAGNQLLTNLGWANGPGFYGNNPGDASYDIIQALTLDNNFTSPYQEGPAGRCALMHPGTVAGVDGESTSRMVTYVGFSGTQFNDMAAAYGGTPVSLTADTPQTISVSFFYKLPSSLYASDIREVPGLMTVVAPTGNSVYDFDATVFQVNWPITLGEPGEWRRIVVELEQPEGIAEHTSAPLFRQAGYFFPIPYWGHPVIKGNPPASWSTKFINLIFECRAFRAGADYLAGSVGFTGNYKGGVLSGRTSIGAGVTDGYILIDDVEFHSSAMEATRYYDRNYFENMIDVSVDRLP